MKSVLTDFRISEIEKENLYKLGFETILVPPSSTLYEAVCGHPDMLLHIADITNIVVHRNMASSFINELTASGFRVLLSDESLGASYPFDIRLNGLNIGNIFLHNLKYTDAALMKMVKNKKLINVKQGYTKCSAAIVNEQAVITSDKGIYNSLVPEGIDVLLLPPGHIELPGLNYGFIGGCCGLLEEGTMAFYGDLNEYIYGKEVLHFLKKHDVKPVFLRKAPLIDRGSLFSLSV